MRRILGTLGMIATMLFMACSSDKASSPSGTSSAASSSGAVSSSSEALPTGAHYATMADIPNKVAFPSEAGYSIAYVFGPSGVYSKLYLDGNGATALRAVGYYSLDTTGRMSLVRKDCVGGVTVRDSLCPGQDTLAYSLQFFLSGDSLMAGSSISTAVKVTAATLVGNSVRVSKASDMVGSWVHGDTAHGYVWEFYSDLRYVRHEQQGDTFTVESGIFDVQNSQLVTVMRHCSKACYAITALAPVKKDGVLLLTDPVVGTPDTLSPGPALDTSLQVSALSFTWLGNAPAHRYELALKGQHLMTLNALDASNGDPAYGDEGVWELIGPWLVLDLNAGKACTGNQTIGVMANGQMRCFGAIIGKASLASDTLSFANDFIPKAWTKQ